MTLVSTIIPTYNRARYLRAAIESVLSQERDGVAVEVIVADDGSTDETPEVLRTFGERVRVLRLQRGGPGRARNQGARAARGEWLAFLDSDDLWEPGKLAAQLAAARGDRHLVYTDRTSFGHLANGKPPLSTHMRLPEGDVFEDLLLGNFITLSSVLLRRETFDELGGFAPELSGAEDWDLWLRYAALHPVAVCREPLTRYRRHSGGISNESSRMWAVHLEVVRRALWLPRSAQIPPERVRAIRARACECAARFAYAASRRLALQFYLRALTYHPLNRGAVKAAFKCLLPREGAPWRGLPIPDFPPAVPARAREATPLPARSRHPVV